MTNNWQACKNIVCIRPDNMGDLIMTGPALRALKTSFNARITVLTSSMAAPVALLMPEIDEVMTADMPWVKTDKEPDNTIFNQVINRLQEKQFDAAVIFTVYSQNPLPTVILAYLAGIPKRLAYCRENPYRLLTDWAPDQEPYTVIKHQVQRDLDLVASVGAYPMQDALILKTDEHTKQLVREKLFKNGIGLQRLWLIIHPGVSEIKRQYPMEKWITAGRMLIKELGCQLLITGSGRESKFTQSLQKAIGRDSFTVGGLFNLDEFVALVAMAPAVVSVNTGTIHIAAATGTPSVVLYALTNPQHTPWKAPTIILPFSSDKKLQSKNEVIRFVYHRLYSKPVMFPNPENILCAVKELLSANLNSAATCTHGQILAENPDAPAS